MPPAPSPFTLSVTQTLRSYADDPPSAKNLERCLRLLAKWRAELLANSLVDRSGAVVLSGPFKGMRYVARASEGARASRLIGAYEASLAPVIEEIIASAPDLILDIGCAEGYYSVGLALRLPGARVLARDSDAAALGFCHDMAQANGVADRVERGGQITHADLSLCADQRTVIICDIEGAETDLLDPAAAPALCAADILVECHGNGTVQALTARFADSHTLRRIDRALDGSGLPAWMEELSDLDRLLALWEWRSGPTPWLWMKAKGQP